MNRFPPILVALIFSACTGPQGPQGQTGSQGPAGTYNRAASYCLRNVGVNLGSAWSVSVTCSAVSDIPIEGWCYAGDLPANAYLTSSGPLNWSNTTKPAGWSCTWGWQPNTVPTDPTFSFGGTAEICCATP